MFHMLSCFNLNDDTDIESFSVCLLEFERHMKEKGLIEYVGPIGRRHSDTPMDTDDERNHQYFFLTAFSSREQCDRSYEYILKHTESGDKFHDGIYKKVKDPVFICYEDLSL